MGKVKRLFRRRRPEGSTPGLGAEAGREEPPTPEQLAASPSRQASGVETMLQEFAPWQLSLADPQTGLVNQLLVLDRLGQDLVRRRRHGGEVVVCRIVLDNLGEINLEHGYTAGTAVLSEVARRLTAALRAEDTVGRLSDAVLVAVLAVADEQVVVPLCRRLRDVLDQPVIMGGGRIRLRAYCAAVVAGPYDSAEEVLARAERLNQGEQE